MEGTGRARRAAVAVLLAVNLAVRLYVALRPLPYIDGLVVPDDSYLSLTIARNLAAGLGPLYGDALTNGFQPLFVFLMTPMYWATSDPVAPVHGALVLCAVADTVTLALLARMLLRSVHHFGAVAVALCAWIANPFFILNGVNGLETSLSYCLVLAVATAFPWASERDEPGSRLRFGMLIGLAMFARVDNAFLMLAALCLLWRRGAAFATNVRLMAATAAGAAVVNLPWWLYSLAHFGSAYPVSGRAVRYMSLANVDHAPTWANWYWPEIAKAAAAVWQLARPEIYVALFALGVCAVAGRRRALAEALRALAAHRLLLATSVLLFLAYSLYVFADWFFLRYLAPVGVVAVLVMGVLLDVAMRSLSSAAARRALVALAAAAVLVLHFRQPYLKPLFVSTDTTTWGYMNLGLWAKSRFPNGTTIGASQTGALGYFADELRVVNLDGVVNEACFRSLVEKRNMEYVRSSGVEYFVGWQGNLEFLKKESANFREGDLEPLGTVPGFTSWGHPWLLFRVAR